MDRFLTDHDMLMQVLIITVIVYLVTSTLSYIIQNITGLLSMALQQRLSKKLSDEAASMTKIVQGKAAGSTAVGFTQGTRHIIH